MFAETIAGMLAGFGLFFFGVWTLTDNLKKLSGRRLRQVVLSHTRHPLQGFFWGSLVGAMAQSLAAVVFILVGMVSAGILSMRAAIPVLAGANVGSSMLVFLSTVDLDLAVLLVLGLSGIIMTLVDRDWLRPVMHGLFGLGLLFLGISFIQSNAAPLVQQPWLSDYFRDGGSSFVVIFVLGAIMSIIAQSMSAVTILAISLGVSGILTPDLTILAIYGANMGSGVVTYFLSVSLKGSVRQIALAQIILINVFGTFLFVALWLVERFYDLPLVKAMLESLANDIAGQMAFLYLILSTPIVAVLFALPAFIGLLNRLAPPSVVERDSQPNFILHCAVVDVDAALKAAQCDQNRLVEYLGVFFEIAERQETGHSSASLLEAYDALSTELDYYLEDLGHQDLTPEQFDHLNRIVYRQRVLRSLGKTVAECTRQLEAEPGSAGMARFMRLLRTALETTVMTAKSAHVDNHKRDLDRLADMVGDRSDILAEMRYAYLTKHVIENRQERMQLVQLTVMAERIFWALDMLRKTLVNARVVGISNKVPQDATVVVG